MNTFTNVYLGVPAKKGVGYVLRFVASDMAPALRVYANGRLYTARRQGDVYTADLEIRRDALAAPTVMVTVEWTRDFDPPPGKMLSIELL